MFRYDLLERDSTVIDPQSLLSIHHMMKLFLAAEKKLEDIKTNQHKEMNEVKGNGSITRIMFDKLF